MAVLSLLAANSSAAQSNTRCASPAWSGPCVRSSTSVERIRPDPEFWLALVCKPSPHAVSRSCQVDRGIPRTACRTATSATALVPISRAHLYIFRPVRTGVGDPLESLPYLDKSIVPSGATPPSADWNDMAPAMKAFLTGDRATLIAVKDRVAAMAPETVKFLKSPNSPEDLLSNLGKPFGSWFPKEEPKK